MKHTFDFPAAFFDGSEDADKKDKPYSYVVKVYCPTPIDGEKTIVLGFQTEEDRDWFYTKLMERHGGKMTAECVYDETPERKGEAERKMELDCRSRHVAMKADGWKFCWFCGKCLIAEAERKGERDEVCCSAIQSR
jgi:hypothetical protein